MKKLKQKRIIFLMTPILILSIYVISSIDIVSQFLNYSTEIVSAKEIKEENSKKKKEGKEVKSKKNCKMVSGKLNKDILLYPGGGCVGIKVSTNGVLVVGFSDIDTGKEKVSSTSKKAGIEVGDIILKVNNKDILNTQGLTNSLKEIKDDNALITLDRNDEVKVIKVQLVRGEKDESPKIGLWVRDSTAGIGTLTFYEPESKKFGALGHPITDVDTNSLLKIKNGKIVDSSVLSVKKGQRGTPGELRSIFVNEENYLGDVIKNSTTGIYGKTNNDIMKKCSTQLMKIGYKEEIKEGKAQIISTIDEDGPQCFDIQIVKLMSQSTPSPKSMIIKVTDPKLLNKTGGIVQGMSGSPIIQDGKIVGAVTHVLVNKPDVGYGIYIEWMLKEVEILK